MANSFFKRIGDIIKQKSKSPQNNSEANIVVIDHSSKNNYSKAKMFLVQLVNGILIVKMQEK